MAPGPHSLSSVTSSASSHQWSPLPQDKVPALHMAGFPCSGLGNPRQSLCVPCSFSLPSLCTFWGMVCRMLSVFKFFQLSRSVIQELSGNRPVGPAGRGPIPFTAACSLPRPPLSFSQRLLSRLFCPQDYFPLGMKSHFCRTISELCL